jgi:hypothetical protein
MIAHWIVGCLSMLGSRKACIGVDGWVAMVKHRLCLNEHSNSLRLKMTGLGSPGHDGEVYSDDKSGLLVNPNTQGHVSVA